MPDVKCCNCRETVSEEEMLQQLDEILDEYQGVAGALIPVLQTAQKMFGYLPETVLKKISLKLNKSYSEVAGVVGFYSFFSTAPRGKYLVRVCLGTACYVRGGKKVLSALKKELEIDVGQTTKDRLFSLDVGRCFGACGLAPVIMINDDIHQRVKPVKIAQLLDTYRNNETATKENNG
jgi:NADH:ubiquinone oxidoreductase subunit E